MKILLDENLPHRLRRMLPGHEVFTVEFMGWRAFENGQLLALAASEGFDVLVTKDSNMSYQQNVANLPCSIVVLVAANNSMKRISPLIPQLLNQLSIMKPCTVIRIE